MRIKIITLLCLLNLGLNVSSSLVFASERKLADPTPIVTEYFEKLQVNCACGVKEFEAMLEGASGELPRLVNPIPKDTALLSPTKCLPYWQSFEKMVGRSAHINLDYAQIRSKLEQLIFETKENIYWREEAKIHTENINLEMDFAIIPEGSYKSDFSGEYKIGYAVAMQTTPVTQ